MEFDTVYEHFLAGPDAQGEADLHELGRRVAQHLQYEQAAWEVWDE